MHKLKNHGVSGMTTLYSLWVYSFLFLITLCSCAKDSVTALDCSNTAYDQVCRTYIFENEKSIGYIDHRYPDKQHVKSYNNNRGQTQKTVHVFFNHQNLKSQKIVSSLSQASKTFSYSYNDAGKMLRIIKKNNGQLEKKTLFYYDSLLHLKSTEIFSGQQLDTLITYEYDNSGDLWRKTYYNADSATIKYAIFQYFTNDVVKISTYNSKNVFTGYTLNLYNTYGLIKSAATYDHNEDLVTKVEYFYDSGRLIEKSVYDRHHQRIRHKVLLYND